MPEYQTNYIDQAELAQLVILHALYSQLESKHFFFQGGTAIRWCYGGNRFSEDLDFVTSLSPEDIARAVQRSGTAMERAITAQFGPGSFAINIRRSRATAYRAFIEYRPVTQRRKIAVRVDFERVRPGVYPDNEKVVLATLPRVAHLVADGKCAIPSPNSILVVETKEEILSDKLRALLERTYLKGRDFYDVWFLTKSLGIMCSGATMQRKHTMYEASFTMRRTVQFFEALRDRESELKKVAETIKNDLARFLPPNVMAVIEKDNFRPVAAAVADAFAQVRSYL